jgi:hypothetical protein
MDWCSGQEEPQMTKATEVERNILEVRAGYRSRDAALIAASLDDQTALLRHDLADLTPDELAWQPAPGMNTIGMLLAHMALVEVFWVQVGPEGKPWNVKAVLGIEMDDDGMPMPAGALPPPGLAGRDLAWFLDLHARARAYFHGAVSALSDGDLDFVRERTRRDGSRQDCNTRWVLYHVLEHYSGHYNQILLLRHLYRDARAAGAR